MTLSETEKDVYSVLYDELSKGLQKFECPVEASADQLTKAIDAVLNDHPELFWLDNKYAYTYEQDNGNIKEISFEFYDFADTPDKLHSAKVLFEKTADAILDEARRKPFLVERELYVHDYICKNTVYDETAPYNQSAYSAIVLRKSVCAGYARAFQYLMNRAGITCYYVTGRTEGINGQPLNVTGESGSHSWNMILIEGEYYNVDCLWDDTASETYGSSIYPFFNLTDEAFIYHARISMAIMLPKCSGTKYKYSNYFGQTIEAESIVFE
jgi:transglutaminase-like putative cysteine protease